MNDTNASLITQSLEIASERGGDLTSAVYARLFQERPDLEPLFVMDTNGAVRGEMLSRVFDAILDFIGPCAYAHNLIHAEATTHDGYNVPRETFTLFFTTVADTIKEACGDAWGVDTEHAWSRLLEEIDLYIKANA
ncbi:globin [Vitreimonas flagellata]|uniref:globin n=1 Tax=Vitreimonas flagellata TaxID=2560861 RepID=UPI0010755DC6|nr:globin [Vitreimonas flagellata]